MPVALGLPLACRLRDAMSILSLTISLLTLRSGPQGRVSKGGQQARCGLPMLRDATLSPRQTRVCAAPQHEVIFSLCIVFQTGRPAGMCRRIALRGDGAGELQSHQRAELEAMARAGRHHPALAAQLLDHEALVVGHGVEADLQPVGAPALEAMEQAAA